MAPRKTPSPKPAKQPSTRHYRNGQGGAYDTHKDRSQWFFQRAAFPLRDAPPEAHEKFWQRPELYLRAGGVEWENVGPANYSGRVTCLVVDPTDSHNLYAGAAAGGVWKSTDRGMSWVPCWPKLLNHNIGALVTHPQFSEQLYCATGEGNLSSESYPGSGIFRTDNGGLTWTPTFTAADGQDATSSLPRRVGSIAWGRVGQSDFRIALGAVSNSESLPAALYLDQGANGLQPVTFWGDRSYNCYAVVFHPFQRGRLYAAIEPRGCQNGIWRSDDFGKNWTHLTRGLPPGEKCARISLAICSSSPNVLYALISDRKHRVLGVFRTGNNGEKWREVGGAHFAHESQLSYNNAIAVHPDIPDVVVVGATDLHLSTDGGKNWSEITTGKRGGPGEPFPPNFVHYDHHALLITTNGWIYSGNDGGISMSDDGGKTWQDRSLGMITTMFYAADVAQSNVRVFGGGTQDQGTLIAGVPESEGAPPPHNGMFTRVLGGDGGWIEFDPANEERVFASTSDLIISCHQPGDPWAFGKQLGGWKTVSISPDLMNFGEKDQRAIAVMEIEPLRRKGFKKLWMGTNRLWQSENHGKSWKPISHSFDDSAISAIECSPKNTRVLWVGTSAGGIFRSFDGGRTWSENLSSAIIPRRLITRIATHPTSAKVVVVTVASTGVPGTSLKLTGGATGQLPYSHVFMSPDAGTTWEALDPNTLPDVVYNALAFETHPPYRLFVAGDAGVWMGTPHGWASIAGNMPNVVVSDLVYHHDARVLTAATYGRGIWRLKLDKFKLLNPEPANSVSDAPRQPGLIKDSSVPAPKLLSPADGAAFTNFPRLTKFMWEPIDRALCYILNLRLSGGWVQSYTSEIPELTTDVGTDGMGKWRVWALFSESRRSPASEERSFTYRTG